MHDVDSTYGRPEESPSLVLTVRVLRRSQTSTGRDEDIGLRATLGSSTLRSIAKFFCMSMSVLHLFKYYPFPLVLRLHYSPPHIVHHRHSHIHSSCYFILTLRDRMEGKEEKQNDIGSGEATLVLIRHGRCSDDVEVA